MAETKSPWPVLAEQAQAKLAEVEAVLRIAKTHLAEATSHRERIVAMLSEYREKLNRYERQSNLSDSVNCRQFLAQLVNLDVQAQLKVQQMQAAVDLAASRVKAARLDVEKMKKLVERETKRIAGDAGAKTLSDRNLLAISAETGFLAEFLFHRGNKVADPVGQSNIHALLPDPNFTSEQIGLLGELDASPGFNPINEVAMQLLKPALESFHIRGLLGHERIEHGFGLASRIDAPFDANLAQKLVRPKIRGNDTDRADDRAAINIDLVARAGEPVAARSRDILDKGINRDALVLCQAPNSRCDK